MTFQILRGKAGRATKAAASAPPAAASEPMAIGEDDANIFTCPRARDRSRPACALSGLRHAPRHGHAAQARRGARRVGLVIALAIGGGVIGAIILMQNAVAVGLPPASAAAPAGHAAPVPTVDPALPALARSGLRQTTLDQPSTRRRCRKAGSRDGRPRIGRGRHRARPAYLGGRRDLRRQRRARHRRVVGRRGPRVTARGVLRLGRIDSHEGARRVDHQPAGLPGRRASDAQRRGRPPGDRCHRATVGRERPSRARPCHPAKASVDPEALSR